VLLHYLVKYLAFLLKMAGLLRRLYLITQIRAIYCFVVPIKDDSVAEN